MENSRPPQPSQIAAEAGKADARWKAERAALDSYQLAQARRWKVMHQRPRPVLAASVTLTGLAGLALAAAPFIASIEQMKGPFPWIGHAITVPLVVIGLVLLPLGIGIGRAGNWARWMLMLVVAAAVTLVALQEWPVNLCAAAPLVIGVIYAILLFNKDANRFFR